jgi:predicted permease
MSGLHDLWLRLRALVARRRVEDELDEELQFHLAREAHELTASGMSPADARAQARRRFGPVALAADLCRDVRGTALVDTLIQDVAYASRAVRRAPLVATTIVATVALGLGLVAAVFTVYSALFLRVDAVPHPEELFAVWRPVSPGAGAWIPWTGGEYERLRRETDVFTGVVAMGSVQARIDGHASVGALITGNFFDVLGMNPALGRGLTPIDDATDESVIVLSHRGWSRLFTEDIDAVGRTVRIDGLPHQIVGVMPKGFRGLSARAPDYWAPRGLGDRLARGQVQPKDERIIDNVVGRLRPDVSPRVAEAALTTWASRTELRTVTTGPPVVTLKPSQGVLSQGATGSVALFASIFFAFGLILLIGCANVANLLLARGVQRGREIGVRLALGASRGRVIRQLLTESLLLALAAAAGGLLVSRWVLSAALYLATTSVPPELAAEIDGLGVAAADWRVVVFLVVGAVLSMTLFGLTPALHATYCQAPGAMRGAVTVDTRPGRMRHVLIAAQVGASAVLLICAAVFLRGALRAATVDPGLRTDDTIVVPIANESLRGAILHEVRTHPSVAAVAAVSPSVVSPLPFDVVEALGAVPRSQPVEYQFVSPEYFDVLGIRLSRGRVFSPTEQTVEAGVAIVSEATARDLWPDRDPLGQTVGFGARAHTVIGVVRDIGTPGRTFGISGAGLYLPTGVQNAGASFAVRVRDDPDRARRGLVERLTRIDPALGDVQTVRAMVGTQTFVLRLAFRVAGVLGGLALLLTVSGLFGVLSYVVAQRTKEIGVRMALGATRWATVRLILSQSFRPVLIGLVAGGGLAAGVATALRSTRAADEIATLVRVLDPVAYATSLLVIVGACALAAWVPAMRAARIDPIATLRED